MKQFIKTFSLIAFTSASISFTGCEESEISVPINDSPISQVPNPPGDIDPQTPGNPDQPGGQSPVEPSNPVGPAITGAIRKINWAPMDFKTFEYDPSGALLKYIRQYNYVQGTDIVLRDEFTYDYDAKGKIISVVNKDGFRTTYTYSGEVWSEALSYDKLNRPLRKYEFQFNAKKQLISYQEFNAGLDGTITPRSKSSFTYDANGNLIRYVSFWYQEDTNSFVRSADLQFSNFDNKKYPKNADSFNYILQPLTFFVNNPGKKEFIGNASPIEYYSYTYDENGYPLSKETSYSAEKPLPSLHAAFEY